ncbi:DUF3368 domain-containing protein [soil metagenome]
MRAISNATPLIYLGKLGQLDLLFKLFEAIFIPTEVYKEVVTNGLRLGVPEAELVRYLVHRGNIQVVQPILPTLLPAWAQPVDAGEIEVILLAQQHSADWVLIDNQHARQAARKVGLSLKGTVGLLLDAYYRQIISLHELEFLLYRIKSQPDFWVSDRLCDQALARARQAA